MIRPEFLVVGAGLTGATVARVLTDAGKKVLIVDRRDHFGGNVADYTHRSGIRIHRHGPHYFRTNCKKLWEFVNRFADFRPYAAVVRTVIDGRCERWPIHADYIRRTVGENWQPSFIGTPENFEEASLANMPQVVYEKFVKGYTEKQWGVPATALSVRLARRFDVREGDDRRLMLHKYQGIPADGYTEWVRRICEDIPTIFNCDYLQNKIEFRGASHVIFTGPIDEYFGFDAGRLKYRSQRRKLCYVPDQNIVLPAAQCNYPSPECEHIRVLEWKQMMPEHYADRIRGTVLTYETPFTPDDPNDFEYPFPDDDNARLYSEYQQRTLLISHLLICGRLGEYRYYDMDQAIARAQLLADRLIK